MRKKTHYTLLIIILMLTLTGTGRTVRADDSDTRYRYGWEMLQEMDDRDDLCWAYDRISSAMLSWNGDPAALDISLADDSWQHAIDTSQCDTVMKMIYADYPELFWWPSCGYTVSYTADNMAVSVRPFVLAEISSPDAFIAAKTEIEAARDQILSDSGALTAADDYEKSLLLHDAVAEAVSYNTENMQHENNQTLYGALAKKICVCTGYSQAYACLLHELGIPAALITGQRTNPETGLPEGHAWNIVCLDGKHYHADVTWDDQPSFIYHAYLNLTTEQIEKDHTMDSLYDTYAPVCTAVTDNFFERDGCIIDTLDDEVSVERFAAALAASDCTDAEIRIPGFTAEDTGKIFDFLNANTLSIFSAANIVSDGGINVTCGTLSDEFVISLSNCTHQDRFDRMVDAPAFLKSPATCQSPAIYYTSCICGQAGEETFSSGPTGGHCFVPDDTFGTNGQWQTCSVCGRRKHENRLPIERNNAASEEACPKGHGRKRRIM